MMTWFDFLMMASSQRKDDADKTEEKSDEE